MRIDRSNPAQMPRFGMGQQSQFRLALVKGFSQPHYIPAPLGQEQWHDAHANAQRNQFQHGKDAVDAVTRLRSAKLTPVPERRRVFGRRLVWTDPVGHAGLDSREPAHAAPLARIQRDADRPDLLAHQML